ncbi:MAG TPA: hypothetical protein DD670_18840 [Planctomycetaceae bacterium]|nr:hypothetical protein [Planctomycetaceae bacterium]
MASGMSVFFWEPRMNADEHGCMSNQATAFNTTLPHVGGYVKGRADAVIRVYGSERGEMGKRRKF